MKIAKSSLARVVILSANILVLVSSCAVVVPLGAVPQTKGRVMSVRQEIHHDVSPAVRNLPRVSGLKFKHREAEPLRLIPLPPGLKPPEEPDSVLQKTAIRPAAEFSPLVTIGFDGIGQGEFGFNDCCAPPDTNGAVGLTQYVQWVNLSSLFTGLRDLKPRLRDLPETAHR